MQPCGVITFCAKFNQYTALNSNRFFFHCDYTKKSFSLIWCFDRNKYVQSYRCLVDQSINKILHTLNSTFTFKVYPLFYSNYPLASQLSLRSTKKQFFNFSLIDITKFLKSVKNLITPVLVIDGNLGYITGKEAFDFKIGGRLFCVLYRFLTR